MNAFSTRNSTKPEKRTYLNNITKHSSNVEELKEKLQEFNKSQLKLPSNLLLHLRGLIGPKEVPNHLRMEIWLSSLPATVSKRISKLPLNQREDFQSLSEAANIIFRNVRASNKRVLKICKKQIKATEKLQKAQNKMAPKQTASSINEHNQTLSNFDNCQTGSTLNDITQRTDPQIVELKEILKLFNQNYDKDLFQLDKYLKSTLIKGKSNMTNQPFRPFTDDVIRDIVLSSLPPHVLHRIQLLPANHQRSLYQIDKQYYKTYPLFNQPLSSVRCVKKAKVKTERRKKQGLPKGVESQVIRTEQNTIGSALTLAVKRYENKKQKQNAPCKLKPEIKKKATFHKKNETARLASLLTEFNQNGAKKPSEILKFLREKTFTQFNDDNLKLIWLDHLPEKVKSFLSTESATLDELAVNADDIYNNLEITPKINLKPKTTPDDLLNKMKLLLTTIDVLSNKLESLNVNVDDLTVEFQEMAETKLICQCDEKWQPFKKNVQTNPLKIDENLKSIRICYYHRLNGRESKKCDWPCFYQAFITKRKRDRMSNRISTEKTRKYPFTVEYKNQINDIIENGLDIDGI